MAKLSICNDRTGWSTIEQSYCVALPDVMRLATKLAHWLCCMQKAAELGKIRFVGGREKAHQSVAIFD